MAFLRHSFQMQCHKAFSLFFWEFCSFSSLYLIDFELIFAYDVKQRSNFLLLLVNIQFSPESLWMVYWIIFDHICEGLFLNFLLSLLFYVSVFMAVPQCFDYHSFVISFKLRTGEVFKFILFQDYFGYLGSLRLYINFSIIFKFFNAIKILIGITLILG